MATETLLPKKKSIGLCHPKWALNYQVGLLGWESEGGRAKNSV